MASRTPRAPRVTLQITDSLIADAIPRDSSHCLWAEAVKAAVPDATHIAVDLQTIRFTDPTKGLRYTYLTPRVAQVALVNFDQGVRPEPHSCRLSNGQVTRSGNGWRTKTKELSNAQVKQRKNAAKVGHESLAKARLVSKRASGTQGEVPDKIGGKTPPIAFGRRRAFGLRAMDG